MDDDNAKRKRIVRGMIIGLIVVVLVVAAGCAVWILTGGRENADVPPVPTGSAEPVASETPELEEKPFSVYWVDTDGCEYLSAIAVLVENTEDTTPLQDRIANIFLAKIVAEEVPEEETTEERLTRYVKPVNEMLSVVRTIASSWDMPYDEYQTFMGECQYSRNDKYLILVGSKDYESFPKAFDLAVTDPAILDFEDLVAAISAIKPAE